ncbi:MAG: DUF3108 domain-containing protein [Candidatus Delongbacteria bacterium]|nr:DUF3108 domain-containing protein [Candidatus Delongbacteria bacterium]MCG2760062.1 DUF3108 domain-containing protein [Candidatus Delongbacteria bacterium]
MMKKIVLIIYIIINLITLTAQDSAAKDSVAIKKTVYPFSAGEYLHFEVNYGIMLAGYATIEVHEDNNFSGRDAFIFKTTAKSRRAFDWIFKVRDWTKSYFDKEKTHTLKYEKQLREGSYEVDIDIDYDQTNRKATYFRERKGKKNKSSVIDIPENVMDPLSSLFFVRTLVLKVGDEIIIPATDNLKVYDIKVIVHKIETIEVPAGKFKCFAVEPVMADGGVFKKDGKIMVWLTADNKKMPVKMETKIYIGSIVAELDWFTIK